MNFGPILTNLEPFLGQVVENAKSIIMNMIMEILLIFEERPVFLMYCRASLT
jgi:hypothetical protein